MRIDMKNQPDKIIYESESCCKKIDDITFYFNRKDNKVRIWFCTMKEEFTLLEMEPERAKQIAINLLIVAKKLENVYRLMKEDLYGSD